MKTQTVVRVGLVGMACILVAGGCKKAGPQAGDEGFVDTGVFGQNGMDTLDGFDMPLPGSDFSLLTPIAGQFSPVYFDYDSSNMSAGERVKTDPVMDIMTQNPRAVVTLEGHCDERGSREYNLSLGDNRAQAVRDYMIGQGIDSQRIQVVSYGEENPASPGHTESDYSMNRRVEFLLAE